MFMSSAWYESAYVEGYMCKLELEIQYIVNFGELEFNLYLEFQSTHRASLLWPKA